MMDQDAEGDVQTRANAVAASNDGAPGLLAPHLARLDAGLDKLDALSSRLERFAGSADTSTQGDTTPAAVSAASRRTSRLAAQDKLAAIDRKIDDLSGRISVLHWMLGDLAERSLMLQGRIAAHVVHDTPTLECLAEAEFRVYSQWGEDGIIDWLAANLDLPNHRFVEFGVEDFREANCRFLLQHRNWSGLVLDGSSRHMKALRGEPLYWRSDLTATAAFIDAGNIDALIKQAGFAGSLGILSIDLDGNDYWVWKAITCVDPAIVICEYNAVLGDLKPITIPYEPKFDRFEYHSSGQYFGASLPALERLASEKGYVLVGTSSAGVNAFFVRHDLAPRLLARLRRVATFPSLHRDSRDVHGELSFVRGQDRLDLIRDMPVVNVETGVLQPIDASGPQYSEAWLRLMEESPDRAATAGAGR